MIELFDSHCHLGFHPEFDAEALWANARDAGVLGAVDVGIDLASSLAARGRAAALAGVRWSAGLHPTETGAFEQEWSQLRDLAADPTCAAIGETGLDFYWDKATPREQEHSFRAHLALARDLDLPVILHCRDAFADTYRILSSEAPVRGVMHCFSGGPDEAARAVELGLHVSFAGPVSYPKNDALRAAAALVPADRVLVETDAPFLPPKSRRGQKNQPAFVGETAAAVADARSVPIEELAAQTTANARRLFGQR